VSTLPAPPGLPPGLTEALVDDAAVFPPGNAPLADAIVEHRRHRSATYRRQVGPLLLPAGQAAAATELLRVGERLRVALIVRPGADAGAIPAAVATLSAAGHAVVVGVELALSDLPALTAAAGPDRTDGQPPPTWLEVTRESIVARLGEVSALGAHAKFRTGGVGPGDFPDERTLAEFIVGCRRHGLRFKLTAGLHHAVRGFDRQSGLEHHGVANVLLATARSVNGSGARHRTDDVRRDVGRILAERDPARLGAGLRALDASEVAATRASFASFGCCGVTDPITGLAGLAG
jgi:hypothetical protein